MIKTNNYPDFPLRMAMEAAGHMAASYPLMNHPPPGHPQWDPASPYMYWNNYAGDMAAAHQINQQIMT